MNTRKLPCGLTDSEYEQRSQHLAELIREHVRIKDEAREHAREAKARADSVERRIFEISDVVTSRIELRDVPVIEERNFEQGTVDIIRRDTGEVIDSRPMHPEDQQVAMFDANVEARR